MAIEEEQSILFAERPEWADVTPLAQYENINPVAPIFYTNEYKDAADYFRGIVNAGEMSPRVLELTEKIIRMNPAHYSAWQYRYKTLMALKSPLDVELHLMDEIAVKYLKTYQVWHHRRLIVTQTRNPGPELAFIAKSLQADTKNYHTWSYRQWILAYFNDDELWDAELPFVEEMLENDLRNNSAWHHRFFVVFQAGVRKGDEDRDEVIRRELGFVKQSISVAPNNASAWNYLRGILDHNGTPYSDLQTFVNPYSVPHTLEETAEGVVDLENPLPSKESHLPAVAAIEFMADIYEKEGGDSLMKATELWKSLANEHDTIRKKYWEYRIREACQKVTT
ncbi:protein prenylyltransferase [Leucogyrophana mollusca]|uniref:Protein prenylyltransferase n=1 Tax=Leucogyrophana mollusca TaxID=85980 RepID=A0ACB8BUR6_9AGAM|nr:protein prenylyltransferase [Leucogyrophana mollusca]